jgi:hypothetical protein
MAEPSKTCSICGRTIAWRAKWAKCWDQVRRCSDACRRRRLGRDDEALEKTILDLLHSRRAGATICPSEAARAVLGEAGLLPEAMQRTRYAANRLVAAGSIDVTQGGRVVDPSTARGPIRLRLRGS